MKEGKKLILYVDDDADLVDAIKLRLENAGYAVNAAHSGEEGLRSYLAEKPDFIIVDLMMEEIDSGTTLVSNLKAEGNKAPVYMLSSTGDQLNIATDYKGLGLDGVFQKPINFDILLKTLKAKLG
ncbi:MAG: response regulator [Deltaproteobacteria bacterium]|nr:response regulator [Deltaproteobacteria bacterium]